jgi:hypothetical protein
MPKPNLADVQLRRALLTMQLDAAVACRESERFTLCLTWEEALPGGKPCRQHVGTDYGHN